MEISPDHRRRLGQGPVVGDREEGVRRAARQEEAEVTEPRYGRFDEAEFRRRGDDRRLVLDGKPYRIAELVPLMDGSARYQAWPVEIVADVTEAVEEILKLQGAEDARAREEAMTVPSDDMPPSPQPPVEAPRRPVLATWARANGWKGHGPIPKDVRARYQAEFEMAWPVEEG